MVIAVVSSSQVITNNFRKPQLVETRPNGTHVMRPGLFVSSLIKDWVQTLGNIGFISKEDYLLLPDNCTKIIYINPLDGTSNFICGLSNITTVMTLMELRGTLWFPTKAIIYDPINCSIWTNEEGGVTNLDNFQCSVINNYPSRVTISTWPNMPFNLERVLSEVESNRTLSQQQFGAIALGGGLIASGFMDATVFGGESAVETAAMSLIVRGAGGVATDLFGEPLNGYQLEEINGKLDFSLPCGAIISSSQQLNDQLVNIVQKFITCI